MELEDALQPSGVRLLHRRVNERARAAGKFHVRARLAQDVRNVGWSGPNVRPQPPPDFRVNGSNLLGARALKSVHRAIFENDLLLALNLEGSFASCVGHCACDPYAWPEAGLPPVSPAALLDSRLANPPQLSWRWAPLAQSLGKRDPARRLPQPTGPPRLVEAQPLRACIVPRCAGVPQACWQKRVLRGCC